MRNYYKILGVKANASSEDIKKKYRVLAFAHHPDKNQNSESSHLLFTAITEAYQILSSPTKRQQYDLSLVKNNINYFQDYTYKHDANSLLQLILKTKLKVDTVSSDDINQNELTNSLLFFYSLENRTIIEMQNDIELKEKYLLALVSLIQPLKYKNASIVFTNIEEYLRKEEETMLILYKLLYKKKLDQLNNSYKPLLIGIAALLICIIIYHAAKK